MSPRRLLDSELPKQGMFRMSAHSSGPVGSSVSPYTPGVLGKLSARVSCFPPKTYSSA